MNRTMRSLLCGLGVVALAESSPKLVTPEAFPALYVSPDNGNVLSLAGLKFPRHQTSLRAKAPARSSHA